MVYGSNEWSFLKSFQINSKICLFVNKKIMCALNVKSANRSVQHVAQLNVTRKGSISNDQPPATKPLNKLLVCYCYINIKWRA